MKQRIHTWFSIPLLLFLLYVLILTPLMGRKSGYTVDATPSFHLTQAIVNTGDFFPDISVKQGYLYSIVYIPFYGMGTLIADVFSIDDESWVQRKSLCWMNTVITALQLSMLALILRSMRFSVWAQTAIPIFYGFSTIAFAYARFDYNKCLAGLLILCALWCFLKYRYHPKTPWALLTGVFLGFLITLRAELGIIAIPLGIGIAWLAHSKASWVKHSLAFGIPLCLGALFFLVYNWIYWQGNVSGGYEGQFVLNPFPALIGFLFSPGKSLFLFNPILIALPLMLRRMYERMPWEFSVWGLVLLFPFLLYCFWPFWWGGWGWGPRHLVPLIPLMVIPLALMIDSGSTAQRTVLILLTLLGVLVQWAGTCVDPSDVIQMLYNANVSEQETIWTPVFSPLYHHIRVLTSVPVQRWDYAWVALSQTLNPGGFVLLCFTWFLAIGLMLLGLFHVVKRSQKYNSEKHSAEGEL